MATTRPRRPLPPTPGGSIGLDPPQSIGRSPVNTRNKPPPPEPVYDDGGVSATRPQVEQPRLPVRHVPQPTPEDVFYDDFDPPPAPVGMTGKRPLPPVPGVMSGQRPPVFKVTSGQLPPVPGVMSGQRPPVPGVMSGQRPPVPGVMSGQRPVPGVTSGQRPPPVGSMTAPVSNVEEDEQFDDVYEDEPDSIPICAPPRPQPLGMVAQHSGSLAKPQLHVRPLPVQSSVMHKTPEPKFSPASSIPLPEVYEALDEVSGMNNRLSMTISMDVYEDPNTMVDTNMSNNNSTDVKYPGQPSGPQHRPPHPNVSPNVSNISPSARDMGPSKAKTQSLGINMLDEIKNFRLRKAPSEDDSNKKCLPDQTQNETPIWRQLKKTVAGKMIREQENESNNSHKDNHDENLLPGNSIPHSKPVVPNKFKPVAAEKPLVPISKPTIGRVKIPEGLAAQMGGNKTENLTPRSDTPPLPPPPSTEDLPPPLPPNRPVRKMANVPDSTVASQNDNVSQTPSSHGNEDVVDTQAHCSEELSCYPWYRGSISRTETERLLRSHGGDGVFLVRNSKQGSLAQPYTMSILYHNSIFTLKVRRRSDGEIAMGEEKLHENTFGSVSSMISHHNSHDVILIGNPGGRTTLMGYPPV